MSTIKFRTKQIYNRYQGSIWTHLDVVLDGSNHHVLNNCPLGRDTEEVTKSIDSINERRSELSLPLLERIGS